MKHCPKHINAVLHTDTNKFVYKFADWDHHAYGLWVKPFLSLSGPAGGYFCCFFFYFKKNACWNKKHNFILRMTGKTLTL
jgi:hypothetical protein